VDDPQLIGAIERHLREEVDPANVTFEITETAAVENLNAAGELVTRLRELGCGISLDDFGTGYGSFTYLKHLPVTELKIDMEFTRGLVDDPADRRVVRSMLAVARNFDIRTVAEGVEDEATAELLSELGVDLLQGYYIGRPAPMPAPAGPALDLRTSRRLPLSRAKRDRAPH
jgi:EAL domain-containing protein (putative c-di-GMP-specific phosphodiesterase class I)